MVIPDPETGTTPELVMVKPKTALEPTVRLPKLCVTELKVN